MPKHDVKDLKLKTVGEIELSDAVFGAKDSKGLVHEAVKAALANARQGTACTKTRAEVKATNAKPYRQKGTGRARHGSSVSPIFVGGGITFGPKPRDYSVKLSKKKKRAALKAVLTIKAKENKLLIIDKWEEKKKTKEMAAILNAMKVKKALLVVAERLEWLERTVGNIPYIDVTTVQNLNTFDIVSRDFLICTKDVVAKIEEGLAQ